MDLTWSPDEEAFGQQVRTRLTAKVPCPPGWRRRRLAAAFGLNKEEGESGG
jgi:hypothetical protein